MAAALQDVDVTLGIHGHGARIDERSCGRLGPVFRHAAFAVAGDRADDPGFQVHGADAAVVEVREIHLLALRVDGHTVDAAELGLGRRAAVATEAFLPSSRGGGDDAGPAVNLADAVVPGVRY